MTCPACGGHLSQVQQVDVVVDVCREGCGGIWFDHFELAKVDDAHEAKGESLLDLQAARPVSTDRSAQRRCPKCPEQVIRRHYFSVKREVEIDDCPRCGGIWLDAGEFAAIRRSFATEQEHKQAADQYFKKLFEKDLVELGAKDQATLERAKKFSHAIRFICPSYWIPGKQSWGTF